MRVDLAAWLGIVFLSVVKAQDICSSGLPVADGVCSNGGEIPGVAGVDYPVYAQVPVTNFRCDNIGVPGYYADPESGCQAFYICGRQGKGTGFLCPNGTLFNQEVLVCDWWTHVDCNQAVNFYAVNQQVVAEMEAASERLGVNQRERERLAAAGINPNNYPFDSRNPFNRNRNPDGSFPPLGPINTNRPIGQNLPPFDSIRNQNPNGLQNPNRPFDPTRPTGPNFSPNPFDPTRNFAPNPFDPRRPAGQNFPPNQFNPNRNFGPNSNNPFNSNQNFGPNSNNPFNGRNPNFPNAPLNSFGPDPNSRYTPFAPFPGDFPQRFPNNFGGPVNTFGPTTRFPFGPTPNPNIQQQFPTSPEPVNTTSLGSPSTAPLFPGQRLPTTLPPYGQPIVGSTGIPSTTIRPSDESSPAGFSGTPFPPAGFSSTPFPPARPGYNYPRPDREYLPPF